MTTIRSDGITGFFHLSGTTLGLTTTFRGCAFYFLERFDAGAWLEMVTVLGGHAETGHGDFERAMRQPKRSPEIEAEILKTHDVLDVVVVPVPVVDEQQLPCATVVPRSKAVLTDPVAQQALTKSLTGAVAQEMAPYKHLTGSIIFVDSIPRNATRRAIVRHAARIKVLAVLGLTSKNAISVWSWPSRRS
ncbi:hypothetical protein AMAG_09651 [Allomyces macrogynus ATCC 38327]|uniref:AMP-binding enzyme C-terminal domain-containing protein n=1 Tax=Allomyces macrogynus (strain ATCC 38327) TaxID=578462 RepID=A0A0L0STL7_ALLM3|nr:hypothetical protein AMAG_09651 [Allomyces macrogynus ATCC 38327]|eukprot:KNE65669.1 hypothetical protein AMAG_09651 [Allomyces macrogynus ATCC 38327]